MVIFALFSGELVSSDKEQNNPVPNEPNFEIRKPL